MTTHATTTHTRQAKDSGRWVIWTAGLIVALGAAIATAHGLYEVAIAATVPEPIAWLYPLITDGLALVAYASTTRLAAGGRRYAWSVVVLAAGLSGLAQASYLAIGVHTTPAELRAGVGAWPAVAAAITAHLLYLLAAHPAVVQQPAPVRPDRVRPDHRRTTGVRPDADSVYDAALPVRPDLLPANGSPIRAVRPDRSVRHDPAGEAAGVEQLSEPLPMTPPGGAVGDHLRRHGQQGSLDEPIPRGWPSHPAASDPHPNVVQAQPSVPRPVVQPGTVRPDTNHPVQPADTTGADPVRPAQPVQPLPAEPYNDRAAERPVVRPDTPAVVRQGPPTVRASDGPGERARAAALAHLSRHGALPTVSALMELADIGRGTAGTALKQLRDSQTTGRPGLHVVHDDQTGTSR